MVGAGVVGASVVGAGAVGAGVVGGVRGCTVSVEAPWLHEMR